MLEKYELDLKKMGYIEKRMVVFKGKGYIYIKKKGVTFQEEVRRKSDGLVLFFFHMWIRFNIERLEFHKGVLDAKPEDLGL